MTMGTLNRVGNAPSFRNADVSAAVMRSGDLPSLSVIGAERERSPMGTRLS